MLLWVEKMILILCRTGKILNSWNIARKRLFSFWRKPNKCNHSLQLFSKKDRWRPKRKLLTPTFHYDILKDFVPVFNEQAKILVQKMGAACGKTKGGTVSTNGKVEVLGLVTLCMLDIICETSMGRSVNAQMQEVAVYSIIDWSSWGKTKILMVFSRN